MVSRVVVGVSIVIIAGFITWITTAVIYHDRQIASHFVKAVNDKEVREIIEQEVSYPWLSDRGFVMSALTDNKAGMKQMRDTIDAVRSEQIKQSTLYKVQGDAILEIRDILKEKK